MNKKDVNNTSRKHLKEIKEDIEKRNKKLYLENKDKLNDIDIYLSKSNTYQEFSNNTLLNESIYTCIEEKFKLFNTLNLKYNINLIFDDSFTIDEKEKVKEMIKDHYAIKSIDKRISIRRTNVASIICLIAGIFLLTLYSVFSIYLKYEYSEILSIFAWVFVWESCDLFCFSNASNKKDEIKYNLIYDSIINIK